VPEQRPPPPPPPLLELLGIQKRYGARPVLCGLSLTIQRGEAVALVGESGSGKSTLGRIVVGLEQADAGRIFLDGEPGAARRSKGPVVQMVFQDPFASLNPAHPVRHHLERPLLLHRKATRRTVRAKCLELLETVGLAPAEEMIDRHPHQLSGGQRQRVAIARALAAEPDLLVADEPTSMLDVSLRAGVLKLLSRLKRERGLALLLITHDLVSAGTLADRIAVLSAGQIVEVGEAKRVIAAPMHDYTRALLSAVAVVD
jgi:peptide/nickel transport system ATP-binding protein